MCPGDISSIWLEGEIIKALDTYHYWVRLRSVLPLYTALDPLYVPLSRSSFVSHRPAGLGARSSIAIMVPDVVVREERFERKKS